MTIDGCRSLIARCHFCGRLREFELNLFEVMKGDRIEYICKCGEIVASVKGTNRVVEVEATCFNCGDRHIYNLDLPTIFKDKTMLYCIHGDRLCFIGSKEAGKNLLGELDTGIDDKDENGEMDYFNNFKIFSRILGILYSMKLENKIYCDCGHEDINIELFSDRIELECLNCHSVKIIFAETEEDLRVLLKKDRIVLKERSVSCIDSMHDKNRDIKE